jgi:hypothetical protein
VAFSPAPLHGSFGPVDLGPFLPGRLAEHRQQDDAPAGDEVGDPLA